jgi:hypothetical protein
VRAAELRCRDDWGHDKWEAQTASDQVLDVVMNDAAAPLPDRQYIPPTERTVPDVVEPAALRSAALLPIDHFGEAEDPLEPARAVSADLNRELLRQAHAQFRERQRNKRFSVPQQRDAEPEPLVISNQYIPPSRDLPTAAPQVDLNSVFEFDDHGNSDAFDVIPDLDESHEVPRVWHDDDHKARPRSRTPEPRPLLIRPEEDFHAQDFAQPVVERALEDEPPAAERTLEPTGFQEHVSPRAEYAPDQFTDPDAPMGGWEVDRHSARPAEATSLWADIPKCCLTCRDFRPAGNGERGWCNNQWAFKHRRMVDAHDRPCETSIGHWWIPGDAAWQGDFDISALGQPTPLMDKWFGRSVGDEPLAAPVERRRRKTGSW